MNNEEESEELIYYHEEGNSKGIWKWIGLTLVFLVSMFYGFLPAMVLCVILGVFNVEIGYDRFMVFYFFGGLLNFWWVQRGERKSKPSYKIYDDRIEFFNEKYPLEKDIIDLAEIDQARYEDDFGKSISSGVPDSYFIYCYFVNDYKSKSKKIKNDRLKLMLSKGKNMENDIIQILQFFQKKKKQVYISTKHEEINTALNLKNWTEPDVRLPFRL